MLTPGQLMHYFHKTYRKISTALLNEKLHVIENIEYKRNTELN